MLPVSWRGVFRGIYQLSVDVQNYSKFLLVIWVKNKNILNSQAKLCRRKL